MPALDRLKMLSALYGPPTTMHVIVRTIPFTVWISRVTTSPTAFRSSADTTAMMSYGPVTVSTVSIPGSSLRACDTSLGLPTAVSIRT